MAFMSSARLQELSKERRMFERRCMQFGSWLITLDGSRCLKCQTRDMSPAGARVFLSEEFKLPRNVYLIDLSDRMAYEADIAWQRSPELGLTFIRAHRLDELAGPLDVAVRSLVA